MVGLLSKEGVKEIHPFYLLFLITIYTIEK
jgi:hypothetical protein